MTTCEYSAEYAERVPHTANAMRTDCAHGEAITVPMVKRLLSADNAERVPHAANAIQSAEY